jgi:hypothetical protein
MDEQEDESQDTAAAGLEERLGQVFTIGLGPRQLTKLSA